MSIHIPPGPRCVIIAGPNGAGKTTFAREFLRSAVDIRHFINADLIASGLSPLNPELAAVSAGRLFLAQLDRLGSRRESFAFESTLSGSSHLDRIRRLRRHGYRIEIAYLRLSCDTLAVKRVAARVRQGGHDVPEEDVRRRFERSWANFCRHYRPLADFWIVFDNSGPTPLLMEQGP